MDDVDLASIEIERSKKRALENNKKLLEDSGILNCIDCDIDLGLRKQAMPSANRCIECQELHDNKRV